MNRFLALLRVELSRLRARRAVLLILAAAIVVPTIIAIAVVIDSRPPSADEVAVAEREVAGFADDRFMEREVERCIKRPGRYNLPAEVRDDPAALKSACRQTVVPTVDDYLYTPVIDLDNELQFGSGLAVVTILGVLMFMAGTTFAGHDWSTGSMSNQLLFEPRRLRVWAAKALALMVSAAVLSAVVMTVYWLTLRAVIAGRDQEVRPGALLDTLQFGWRGAAFAAAAALGGYALTMLSRSTVFSLGLLFGVAVAGGLLLASVGPRDTGSLDPAINAQAVISDGTTYYVEPPERCYADESLFESDPGCITEKSRSLSQGVTYYSVLLGVVGLASIGSFRRRDVP